MAAEAITNGNVGFSLHAVDFVKRRRHSMASQSQPARGLIARWQSHAPYLLSVLRIISAFLFIQFGTAKLFAFPGATMPGGGTVQLASLVGLAGVLETFGGGLVLIGLLTRPTAFLLSGLMAVAYFKAHAARSFWPILNHGEPAVHYCFLWLFFSSAGAGPWSLDALLQRNARPS
jgi:putative oxidoreductase